MQAPKHAINQMQYAIKYAVNHLEQMISYARDRNFTLPPFPSE